MRVWVRTELLCIHFDGLKVKFDQWPIPLSTFQAMLIDRALEHFEDSNCLFVQEELNRFKNQARKIASLLRRRCRLFKKVDLEHPTGGMTKSTSPSVTGMVDMTQSLFQLTIPTKMKLIAG